MNLKTNKNWVSQLSGKQMKRLQKERAKALKSVTKKLKAVCVVRELSQYNWEYIQSLQERDDSDEFIDTCLLILENINKARGDINTYDVQRSVPEIREIMGLSK